MNLNSTKQTNIDDSVEEYKGTVAVLTRQAVYGMHASRFLPRNGYNVKVIPFEEKDNFFETTGSEKFRPDYFIVDDPGLAESVKKSYYGDINATNSPKIVAISADHFGERINPCYDHTTVIKPEGKKLREEILKGLNKAASGQIYLRSA